MPAPDTITSLQGDFEAEIKRRNIIIRNISQQNDNLTSEIAKKQVLLDSLNAEVEKKQDGLAGIDAIFAEKMADFQANVDKVNKSLEDKEDALTKQKTLQASKQDEQNKKDLELAGKLNNIEAMKEAAVRSLTDLLAETNKAVHDAIEDIKNI